MSAPFFKYGLFGDEFSLLLAFVIGVAFGFVLERAGFGNARVLAAQFYFRDLRVVKVMFTAIVTAMLGVFFLARLGFLDLAQLYLTPTFLGPQIVGGLILGAGFVIGGYCPGTSCVSAVTGRLDGLVYLAGLIGGLLGFAEVYPHIAALTHATPFGQVTLASQFDLPYGALVAAIVFVALALFVASEIAERKIGGRAPDPGDLLVPGRRLNPARAFALLGASLAVLALFAGNPYRGPFARINAAELAREAANPARLISPLRLAEGLVAGRNDLLLIDVRPAADYATGHLPGALSAPLATLDRSLAHPGDRLLLYDDAGVQSAQARLLLRAQGFTAVYELAGGLQAWKATVLAPAAPPANASAEIRTEYIRRTAIARFFGASVPGDTAPAGRPVLAPAAPVQSATPAPPPAKKKKKEGC